MVGIGRNDAGVRKEGVLLGGLSEMGLGGFKRARYYWFCHKGDIG